MSPASGRSHITVDPARWVYETQDLSRDAEGALWRLVVNARGAEYELPDDVATLARITKFDRRTWRGTLRPALERFLVPDGAGMVRVRAAMFVNFGAAPEQGCSTVLADPGLGSRERTAGQAVRADTIPGTASGDPDAGGVSERGWGGLGGTGEETHTAREAPSFAGWTHERFFDEYLWPNHPSKAYRSDAFRTWKRVLARLTISPGDHAFYERVARRHAWFCAHRWTGSDHVKDLEGWIVKRPWEDSP